MIQVRSNPNEDKVIKKELSLTLKYDNCIRDPWIRFHLSTGFKIL